MAQKIVGYVRFQVPAGKATPAPPVGPALGQYGVNISQFTKDFNERTKGDMGLMIPVVITVYADQISVLMEEMASVTEFAYYSAQAEEVDVATVIKEREESIRGILKKYSYMDVSDQFLQTLAILDDEELKQVLEYELVELE